MEGDIIFAEEVDHFHIVWVLPPLFPFVSIVGRNGDVTNWSIKPHIEYLTKYKLQF